MRSDVVRCAVVDTYDQIMQFGKLKLAKCAPVPGLPAAGFLVPAQGGSPVGGAARCARYGASGLMDLTKGGLNGPVGCLVFSFGPCSLEPHG
jgi:hypothetical protein